MRHSCLPWIAAAAIATVACDDNETATGAGGAAQGGAAQGGAAQGGTAGGGAGQGGASQGGGGGACGPIEAPEGSWTFVPVAGSMCGTGSPTGFGINPTSAPAGLLVHLGGGGLCYDVDTCTGPTPTAWNFDGYGEADLAAWAATIGTHGVFDRADAANPFRDFNYVFVPYCTGDGHAGNRIDGGLHFVGQQNLRTLLPCIAASFPAPQMVVLSGSSAGGVGAAYNFFLIAETFAGTDAMFIDDSGPLLPVSVAPGLGLVKNVWGLDGTVAPGCTMCLDVANPDGGLHHLIPHYAATLPGSRGSLISSLQDGISAQSAAITTAALETALADFADNVVPANADVHVFYLEGGDHVWLVPGVDGMPLKLSDAVSADVSLATFLERQLNGDPAWTDVRP